MLRVPTGLTVRSDADTRNLAQKQTRASEIFCARLAVGAFLPASPCPMNAPTSRPPERVAATIEANDSRLLRAIRSVYEREKDKTLSMSDVVRLMIAEVAEARGITLDALDVATQPGVL